jgi:hypothetical protein
MESFLTSEQIDNNRLSIYRQFLKKMEHRGGGEFRSVRSSDIKWIFDAYDSTFFKGQISRRLKAVHGDIAFHITKFPEKSECGYINAGSSHRDYFFDISTSIFKVVSKNKYCFDRIICLMFVIEHQIVHLLMLLYYYHEKIPDNIIYSSHGDLYTCMLRLFFGDVDPSHDMGSHIPSKEEKLQEKYQTLVLCHGREHIRVANLDYDTTLFVDPTPESGSDLQDVFPSEKFNNLYGDLKFKSVLLINCPYPILFENNKTLNPDFWKRLNKSLIKEGNVYIGWPCNRSNVPPHFKNIIKIMKDGVHNYGFQWDGCLQLPIFKAVKGNDYGYILTKTKEYSLQLEGSGQIQQIVANRIGRFSNVRNSCFLDSLLFVLLVSDGSNYIRPILFDSDISNIPYNVKYICDRSRTMRSRQQVRDLANGVREILKKDYERLVKGDVFQCNNLRGLLRNCDPEIGSGVTYTPTEVYGIFAHLYPKLQVYFPPKIVVKEDITTGLPMEPRETLATVQKVTFSDLEYSPYDVRTHGVDGFGSFYLWNDINEPLLVFHNTDSNKNKFTEYIFQDRYRLFGAVMSRGIVSPTKEGGGHYNAYLRINGKWFFYDDMPPTTLRLLDKLPDEVFKRGQWSIGELLFYERIKEIPVRPLPSVEADSETVIFKSVEEDNRGNYVLTFKYYDEYMDDVLQALGGKLISKDNESYARWKFGNMDLLRNKRIEIEKATKLNITVSPQEDGNIMIYAEDRYGGLSEELRRLGGKLVDKNKTYYGLVYHLKDRGGVLGENIRDYYWHVSKEEFNHTLSKIQNAKP